VTSRYGSGCKLVGRKNQNIRSSLCALSAYDNSLYEETKRRYKVKLLYNQGSCSIPDPYHLSENWSKSPDTWPDLIFGDIYLYLIDTPSMLIREHITR